MSEKYTDSKKNDAKSKSILETKDQATQTGGIQEEIIKMISIYGMDIEKIYLPGENDQYLSSLNSRTQKFI